MDLETGKRGDESNQAAGGPEGDEPNDEESTHLSPVSTAGKQACLCQQFQRRAFLQKLEAEAVVEFQWMTFYKELVYHVFFPLSLPLIYWFEGGTAGIINRQYWGSRLAVTQWLLAFCFYAVNVLMPFYISPDIVITNILTVMRHMVVATKYGFYTKSDMAEMREKVLPLEVHDERTLFIAWLNPIPLRVLKRQLLLAAIRNNLVNCTASLRVVPGASRHTVKDVMHQLSHEKTGSRFVRRGRVAIHKHHKAIKKDTGNDCAVCMENFCTDKELEDRWVQVCMSRILSDPKCHLPESSETSPDSFEHGDGVGATDAMYADGLSSKEKEEKTSDDVDLPALMLAAYLIQHSGCLLSKKKLWHQILKNPMRTWFAAGCVAIIHSVIPFACRAISGQPSAWGGGAWYDFVVSMSSILLNIHAMACSVSFMLAGVADFRRRYFSARLLNTLLKDGCIGTEIPSAHEPEEAQGRILEQERKEMQERSEYHIGIAVNYAQASSIVGWWIMRVLVLDFGLVFSRRVKYYASYFSVYCGVLMAFLVIELFAKGTRASSYILAVVIYDLIVFIGLLALIVFPGGETNDMHLAHGSTLNYKKMELFTKLRGTLDSAPAKERDAPSFAFEVMQTISEALAWDNTITKVTILGFTAGSEVVGVLLGFAGAAIGIVAQQFTAYVGSG